MPAPPLRILHVTPYYEPALVYGGPARSVPLLCKSLVRVGADVTVLTTDSNGATRLDLELERSHHRDGVDVRYFRSHEPRAWFRSPSLAAACEALVPHYDIVHLTGLWTHPVWAAGISSRRHGKPYVISPRGMLMPWAFGYRSWKKLPYFYCVERRQLHRCAGLHCTTIVEKEALAPFGLESYGFVVPNAIELAEFDHLPPRGQLRERLAIPGDAFLVLFLGRLHPVKGIDLTLSAFAAIKHTHPTAHLVLAGPDEAGYVDALRQWTREHGVSDRVHLPGELRGVERLSAYADADIFILLSESENFGMGVAEAMACSLPVIVSNEVGISPWVKEFSAGYAVERRLNVVREALELCMSNPGARQMMGVAGRQLVHSQFSPEAVGHSMLDMYTTLIDSGRS
jgi:glycosyltransferase involved in cell wall biosynthesis